MINQGVIKKSVLFIILLVLLIVIGCSKNDNNTINTFEINTDALSKNVADYFNNYCENQGIYLYKDFNKNQYKMILYYNKKGISSYSYPVISVKQDASSTHIYIKHINAKNDSECKNKAYFTIITQREPMGIQVYEDENIVNYITSDDIEIINIQQIIMLRVPLFFTTWVKHGIYITVSDGTFTEATNL